MTFCRTVARAHGGAAKMARGGSCVVLCPEGAEGCGVRGLAAHREASAPTPLCSATAARPWSAGGRAESRSSAMPVPTVDELVGKLGLQPHPGAPQPPPGPIAPAEHLRDIPRRLHVAQREDFSLKRSGTRGPSRRRRCRLAVREALLPCAGRFLRSRRPLGSSAGHAEQHAVAPQVHAKAMACSPHLWA